MRLSDASKWSYATYQADEWIVTDIKELSTNKTKRFQQREGSLQNVARFIDTLTDDQMKDIFKKIK
jgi:hypothetical protein